MSRMCWFEVPGQKQDKAFVKVILLKFTVDILQQWNSRKNIGWHIYWTSRKKFNLGMVEEAKWRFHLEEEETAEYNHLECERLDKVEMFNTWETHP